MQTAISIWHEVKGSARTASMSDLSRVWPTVLRGMFMVREDVYHLWDVRQGPRHRHNKILLRRARLAHERQAAQRPQQYAMDLGTQLQRAVKASASSRLGRALLGSIVLQCLP